MFSADVAGFSTMMGIEEEATLRALKTAREAIRDVVGQHGGREFGVYGDSYMAEFDSPVEAVRAAMDSQRAIAGLRTSHAVEQPLQFRIGVHIDDVIDDARDLFGDGVNLAYRIQSIAPPGGISISANVYEHIKRKLHLNFRLIKSPRLKNVGQPFDVYVLDADELVRGEGFTSRPDRRRLPRRGVTLLLGVVVVALATLLIWKGLWSPAEDHGPSAGRMKPAVAILPFATISHSEDESLIARGLADDMTIDLQRFPGIQIFGKESVNSLYETGGVQAVVDRLRPDYLVSASVIYLNSTIKLNIRITEAANDMQVWADRFVMQGEKWFVNQEDMTRQVIFHIADNVSEQEVIRIAKKRGIAMDAYELRQRAKELLNESTPEANESAKSFASQALNLNPGFVEALNDLAYAHIRDYQYGWSDNPQASLEQALALAEQALSIDQNNYVAHWAVATVALYNNDFERSLTEWGRAVELNPQDTDVLASMVDILTAVGRNEEALEKIEEARQLNPEGPAWYAWNLGYVYYMLGRYDDAITTLEGIGEPEPIFLVELAASYAKRGGPGDDAKAVNAMRRVKAGLPDYDLEDAARQPYQSPDLKEHWLSGVRRAFELLNAQQP